MTASRHGLGSGGSRVWMEAEREREGTGSRVLGSRIFRIKASASCKTVPLGD